MIVSKANSIHLFTLFGTPVYMQFNFLLLVALPFVLGHATGLEAVAWAIAVFVSLLAHEFGHVFANRTNGKRSTVVLWMLGGMTFSDPMERTRGWRGIWLSVAGPLAGFAVWAIFWFILMPESGAASGMRGEWRAMFNPVSAVIVPFGEQKAWHVFWIFMCYINLLWGLFNLLPIFPLDGGQALEEILRFRWRALEAVRITSIVSIIAVAGVVGWEVTENKGNVSVQLVVILCLLGFQNFQRLRGGI